MDIVFALIVSLQTRGDVLTRGDNKAFAAAVLYIKTCHEVLFNVNGYTFRGSNSVIFIVAS